MKNSSEFPIHCTDITGNLLEKIIRVSKELIIRHEFNTPFEIDGHTCTFLDANHIPGNFVVGIRNYSGALIFSWNFEFEEISRDTHFKRILNYSFEKIF